MKRIQLFEFEDFPWFPKMIRTGMTNLIVVFHQMMGTEEVIADLIRKTRMKYAFDQIVDLGSGSGGAMPEVIRRINEAGESAPLSLLLTDLHPNPELVKRINNDEEPAVTYFSTPLDATELGNAPAGLKTMMNSFHHMPPAAAKKILRSAQENKEPLLIYEMAENTVPTALWWGLLPLSLSILFVMALFMTPFIKPLRWPQLLFTYLIPLIPLCYAWDGQASSVRIYTFADIEGLLEGMRTDDYHWEMAPAEKANGKKLGYYVLGVPKN
jgi:hypothetical protein